MSLNEIPNVQSWLAQFELPDLYVVEHMLRRLRYVGFEEFEQWLQTAVKGVLSDIEKGDGRVAVAIFPVSKPSLHAHNMRKEEKPPNDSAGRIAHALKNIERDQSKNYVELNPRLDSMRQRKVRHIIYVDDFVGSGDRFSNFWREEVSPSVKSWCSRGWCKIWLVTFAAHSSGLKRAMRKVSPLENVRIRVNLKIEKSIFLENDSMRSILQKYGARLRSKGSGLGYGGLASPLIFQHGCPNNVPTMFWCRPERKSGIRWHPLFPNRSVPAGVYPLFHQNLAGEALPEELWMAGHYQLALNALDRISSYGESHQLMLSLSLLAKGHDIGKIRNTMMLSHEEFTALLKELEDGGLIRENAVTRFGKDVLARAAKPCKMRPRIEKDIYFFPSGFMGFQREA